MPLGPMRTKAQKQAGVKQVMHEWKHGALHSGSKKGPVVKSRAQAIAIALKQTGQSKYQFGGGVQYAMADKPDPFGQTPLGGRMRGGEGGAGGAKYDRTMPFKRQLREAPKVPDWKAGETAPVHPDEDVYYYFRGMLPRKPYGEPLDYQFGGAVPNQGNFQMMPGAGQMDSPMMPAAGGPSYPGNWPSLPFNQQLSSFTPYASMRNQLGTGTAQGMPSMQPMNMSPVQRNYQFGGRLDPLPDVPAPPITPKEWPPHPLRPGLSFSETPRYYGPELSLPIGAGLSGFASPRFEHPAEGWRPVPVGGHAGLRFNFQTGGPVMAAMDVVRPPSPEEPYRDILRAARAMGAQSPAIREMERIARQRRQMGGEVEDVPLYTTPPRSIARAWEMLKHGASSAAELPRRAAQESLRAAEGDPEFNPGPGLSLAGLANMPAPGPGGSALGTLYMRPQRTQIISPYGLTAQDFALVNHAGKELAPVSTSIFSHNPKKVKVDWIGDEEGSLINKLGPSEMRSWLRSMRAEFPDAEIFQANRITGARKKAKLEREAKGLPRLSNEYTGKLPQFSPETISQYWQEAGALPGGGFGRDAPARLPSMVLGSRTPQVGAAFDEYLKRLKLLGAPEGMQFGGGMPYSARQGMFQFARQGMIASSAPGRGDHIGTRVRGGSYIIPADIVSAAGQGNSLAGAASFNRLLSQGPYGSKIPRGGHSRFGGVRMPKMQMQYGGMAGGGPVPVALSGGEYVVEPETVAHVGGGNIDRGHDYFDEMVRQIRRKNVKTLSTLPGPKK